MAATKVLIVDDSITMRALFTNTLDRSRELEVVGAADGAAEAREMIKSLQPDVITLDVEMPGMNGIEFLQELMNTQPIPVVMLSTLTQKGADVSLRALELGAVDCFPKPTKATPDEFDAISAKLCKTVLTAAKSNLSVRRKAPQSAPVATAQAAYNWDGSLVTIVGGIGAIEAAQELLATFPKNCPPTILVLDVDPGISMPFALRLAQSIAPDVKMASDNDPLIQGTVYVAADPSKHVVIDRWPQGSLRLVDREPIAGCRPSTDLLFASAAKTAGAKATGIILSGGGQDGAAGLGAIRMAKGITVAQDPASALVSERIKAAQEKNAVTNLLDPSEIGLHVLRGTGAAVMAA